MSRRLPVYILADTSGSMSGAPIQAVNTGIQTLIDTLRMDPQALESAYISLITFSTSAKPEVPLSDLVNFQAPTLQAGGGTSMWQALRLAADQAKSELITRSGEAKGDYKPLLFLLTDGYATDEEGDALEQFNSVRWGVKVACGAGSNVSHDTLKRISDVTLKIETDGQRFKEFFKWVTQSIKTVSNSKVTEAAGDQSPESVLASIPGVIEIV